MKGSLKAATLKAALDGLCGGKKIQSGEHIEPLKSYCATRLVLEGGFPPEWVSPRPPFSSKRITNSVSSLEFSPQAEGFSETRVLGGIKYKDIDVTVVVPDVGPALAISTKNTGNAFRNLTNRMEEALGECTNVHLMYPGFVFGFFHLLKCTKSSDAERPDVSFTDKGEPLPAISRYHDVLISLAGRSLITDPGMRYEAVGLLAYECRSGSGEVWRHFPPKDSRVHVSSFFDTLYRLYDLRYGYPDPSGPNVRKEWKAPQEFRKARFDGDQGFGWGVRTANG